MELLLLDAEELRQGTGFLDARRAAADNDEGQHAAANLRVRLLVGALEHVQHVIADVQCLLQRLHAVGVLFDFLHAEEVRRRTGCEDEVVVSELTVIRQQDLARLIDTLGLSHEEFHVLALAEERADRIGNLVRREDCRRHLIQQWLEELEIVAVDEHDVNVFLRKEFGKLDTTEACTDNDNTWSLLILLICHDKSSPDNTHEIRNDGNNCIIVVKVKKLTFRRKKSHRVSILHVPR